jgi:SAM-dependent methyltransferase
MYDSADSECRSDWFTNAFDELYPILYRHRDQREAARLLDALDDDGPKPGHQVLDLACGEGRYLRALDARGLRAIGLDLSMPLLRRARSRDRQALLVRADMRRTPLRAGSFDWVLMMFTSFGYFATDAENLQILRTVRSLLRQDGTFLLDYLNSHTVREQLVPSSTRSIDGVRVEEKRMIDPEGPYVRKRIIVGPMKNGAIRTYDERVRLFEPEELAETLRAAGLTVERRYGSYDGGSFEPQSSPRLILLSRTVEESR